MVALGVFSLFKNTFCSSAKDKDLFFWEAGALLADDTHGGDPCEATLSSKPS